MLWLSGQIATFATSNLPLLSFFDTMSITLRLSRFQAADVMSRLSTC